MVGRGPRGDRPSRLLGPDSRRRPWQRLPGRGDDVVLRSGDLRTASPSEARSDLAEGVVDAEGAAAPCWGLVLKCYELRTRQHKMLDVNVLRPTKHYSLGD
jgi:hypothetical protein